MRRIERTKAFKRDYQRAIATPKHRDLDNLFPAVLTLLATDTALPAKYADRAPAPKPVALPAGYNATLPYIAG